MEKEDIKINTADHEPNNILINLIQKNICYDSDDKREKLNIVKMNLNIIKVNKGE